MSENATYTTNLGEAYDGVLEVESSPSFLKLPCGGGRCNAKCTFCPVAGSKAKFPSKEWILLIYEKLTSFIEKAESCCIVDWCEPMLCPYLPDLFSYLDAKCKESAILAVVTNGIYLNWKAIKILTGRQKSIVAVSLNASDSNSYRRVMGVDAFPKVCANVRSLTEIENLEVRLSIVLSLENYACFPDFVGIAKELRVDSIVLQDMFIWTDACYELSCINSPDGVKENIQKGFRLGEKIDMPIVQFLPSSYTRVDKKRFSCCEPWTQLNVANDGEVRLCCFSPISLGNVLRHDIESIWSKNRELVRIRKGLSSGKLTDECSKCFQRWSNADFSSFITA